MAVNIEELKKSFHESVAEQMSAQLDDFAIRMNKVLDKRLGKFEQNLKPQNKSNWKKGQAGSSNLRNNQNRNDGSGGRGNGSRNKPKGQMGQKSNIPNRQTGSTNKDKKEAKEFVAFTRSENTAKQWQCECEIIVNCIPNFKGSFDEIQAHDKFEALKFLQQYDKDVKRNEIKNVRRHPGSDRSKEKMVKVTVLFNNSETPARLARKAEEEDDFSIIQRSLPKDIRDRNMATVARLEDLNLKRPQNCPFLWSITTVKGLKILIQISDPTFRAEKEKEKEETEPETEQTSDNQSPKAGGQSDLNATVGGMRTLNEKLKKTGNSMLTNLPDIYAEDYIEELAEEFGDINVDMMMKVLQTAGMKTKVKKKKSKTLTQAQKEELERRKETLRGGASNV